MIFESYSQIPNVALLDPSCLENLLVTNSCLAAGLLLRKGGRGFSPATTSLSPSYCTCTLIQNYNTGNMNEKYIIQTKPSLRTRTYFRLSLGFAENEVCEPEPGNDFCDVATFVLSRANRIA